MNEEGMGIAASLACSHVKGKEGVHKACFIYINRV